MITRDISYFGVMPPGNLMAVDSVEVHGVRESIERDIYDFPWTHIEMDDENPEYYSVYLRYNGNNDFHGVDCIGDFISLSTAINFANDIGLRYSWPVTVFPKRRQD